MTPGERARCQRDRRYPGGTISKRPRVVEAGSPRATRLIRLRRAKVWVLSRFAKEFYDKAVAEDKRIGIAAPAAPDREILDSVLVAFAEILPRGERYLISQVRVSVWRLIRADVILAQIAALPPDGALRISWPDDE